MTSNPSISISKKALIHNFMQIKKLSGDCKIMCAVKGNAYGHDIKIVVEILEKHTDMYIVARISEAKSLREIGITKPITILGGYSNYKELHDSVKMKCELVIHNFHQIGLIEKYKESNKPEKIWLKIDTGMNRMGIPIVFANEAIKKIRQLDIQSEIGLMTHLSDAEVLTRPKNTHQLDLFSKFVDGFEGDISFANSAAIMNMVEFKKKYKWNNKGDIWVRPGIALYGISPLSGISSQHLNLRAVMTFKSKLISIKKISKGESVGYNSTWIAENDTIVGTVSVGYGDGYTKSLKSGTPVIINNKNLPLIGMVSMDLVNIDLTDLPDCSIGDEVILWGEELPIEEIAKKSGLSAYSLATGITERVERSIID